MSIITQAVEDYVKSAERKFTTNRDLTIGASEVGQCARKVWFGKFEHEPGMAIERDPDHVETWGARTRGNLIENHLLVPAFIRFFGDAARLLGDEQQTFVDGYLSATLDCLLEWEGAPVVIEFKSIDPRVNLAEPKPEHAYQAQVQMGMLRAKTQWRPTKAIVLYVNASFLNDIVEMTVDYDPNIYVIAKQRAAKIMTAENKDELQPEGWIAGAKECEYCAFRRACGVFSAKVPEEDASAAVDPQLIAELSDLARQLKYAEESVALAEKQKREAQFEIKERLRTKGLRRVVGDGVSISWTPVKGRESFDMDALKAAAAAAGLDLSHYSKIGEAGDRLTVTLKAKQAA